jgi:hypothetical protein
MKTELPTVEQVVLAYAAVWSELDGERMRSLVEQSLTPDAQILGPGYHFTGHAAVIAEVERFHAERPGIRAVLASGIDAHHNTARFAVAMLRPDGSVSHEGEDIVLFASDGRIERVLTYWGALPHAPASWPHTIAAAQRRDA